MADHEPGDSVDLTWADPNGATHSARVTLGESQVD